MKNISLFRVFVITFSFLFGVFGQVSASETAVETFDETQNPEPDLLAQDSASPGTGPAKNSPGFKIGNVSFVISVEAKAGFIFGQGEEIVYYGKTNKVLSQLLWDMKPLWYIGGDLALSLGHPRWPLNINIFDASVKAGIPLASGKMEDRDWLNLSSSTPALFSSHDNFTKSAIFLDIDFLGFSFPFSFTSFELTGDLFFRYSYMDLKWAAQDGYKEYGTREREYFHGPAIDYAQKWNFFAIGAGMGISVREIFFADVSFAITPLIFVTADDYHHSTKYHFQDRLKDGLYLEPKITLGLSPNKHLRFSVYFSYRQISGSKGDSYSRFGDSGDYIKSDEVMGGASYRAMDSGISVKISF
jgi:outer membrane protease